MTTLPSVRRLAAPHFLMSEVRCRTHSTADVEGCRFRVAWQINPHMDTTRDVDIERAAHQHDLLRRALVELGAEVTLVPFVHGAYDSVFVKDNAIIVNEGGNVRALLAKPRFAEREREQHNREHALNALGIETLDDADAPLEGGDIALLPNGKGALVGHGFRSSPSSVDALERFLEAEVTPLELVNDRLYHLDTALSVLADGTVLACREAFTAASWRVLPLVPGVRCVVDVPLADALAFGLNLIEVDDAVILAEGAPGVCERLAALGKAPIALPLDELQRAGGSAACLVSRVHEAPITALMRERRPRRHPAPVVGTASAETTLDEPT